MNLNKLKTIVVLNLLTLSVLLTGCSTTQNQSAEGSANAENVIAEKADIEALAAECIFNVNWYTQDGEYSSGTSFLMDSDTHGEKLLVSAFHFLWPENADTFTGSELPEFVLGGEIYNAFSYEETGATLKNCLIIEDADAIPAVDKDVSAFTIQGGDNLKTLPISTSKIKKGDTVYLLANLWDTEDVHENCVYEATVIGEENGVLYYKLDEKYGTSGASGAPIVNEYGEVVAIHIGSNGSTRVAHTAESFMEQINRGSLSDITYPAELTSSDEEYAEIPDDLETYYFERTDVLETTFFNLQIDAVTLADTLQSQPAPDGYQYVILDISLNALDSEPVDMYYSDFVLYWEDDYCYPLETGYSNNQLPDEYVITADVTSGQLIFFAPVDATEIALSYLDYYSSDNSEEMYYNAYYDVYIPVENWTR